MRFSWVLHMAYLLLLLLWIRRCEATPFPFLTSAEGSGDEDLDSHIFILHTTRQTAHAAPPHTTHPPAHAALPFTIQTSAHTVPPYTTHGPVAPPPTAISNDPHVELLLLQQVAGFLQENLFLVVTVCSLLAFVIFIICCASVLSHKRKVNAYYPSSFPTTKYVDQRDKSGGARTFCEVPARPADSPQPEPVDSIKQLQEDILTAARKLRTPTKTPTGGRDTGDPKQKSTQEPKCQLDALQPKEPSTETKQEVTSTETEQEVTPTETEQEVTSTETEQEVTSTETEQEVTSTEIEQEVVSTEIEQEVTSTEIEQEVTPVTCLQEADQPQNKGPDQELSPDSCRLEEEELLQQEAPSGPEEAEPQQEVKSSQADTQEVASPVVQMIRGETTAF